MLKLFFLSYAVDSQIVAKSSSGQIVTGASYYITKSKEKKCCLSYFH
jgi:hypothetical protein